MKTSILILYIVMFIISVKALNETNCEGTLIGDVYHEHEVLKSDVDIPYSLVVDYSTNDLYFSFTVDNEKDTFSTARLNVNTKDFKIIEEVKNGFAQTYDIKTNDVYIGGSDGIYKYNHATNKVEFYGEKDIDIWALYFKEILYYSVFPSEFLYTLIDGVSTRYKDLEDTKVDLFVIDHDDEIFFSNKTGLYGQKRGTKDAILYKELPEIGVRGITTDINGNVYVCLFDGIYSVNKETTHLVKVLDVENGYGVAFDNENNIIFADARSVVRLKPIKDKKC